MLLVLFASLSLLVCGLLSFRVYSEVGVNTFICEHGSMSDALPKIKEVQCTFLTNKGAIVSSILSLIMRRAAFSRADRP